MIDTWLFAALCLFFLALCAILRIIPGPTRFDRIVAANVAMTIAVAGALVLGVSLGNPLVIDVAIVIAALGYAGIFTVTHATKEVGS
jgi:multicomponent Na+:H+ antiporter subunit F